MGKKTTPYARKRSLRRGPDGLAIQPGALASNGLAIYQFHNTTFGPEEIDKLMAESRAGLQAARQGRATYNDYSSLSSAMLKGIAIEDARTIIRGFAPIYTAAGQALKAIEARATTTGNWKAPTLYAAEINALDDLVWAYEQALKVCTFKEFYDRQEVALARTRSRGDRVYHTGEVLEYPGVAQ